MAGPIDVSTLSTEELLRRREATRRWRQTLLQSGGDPQYLGDLELQRVAVWKASCGAVDTCALELKDLAQASNTSISPETLNDGEWQALAEVTVAEVTGSSVLELAGFPSGDLARWLGFASAEIEAELLARLHPDFQKTSTEKAAFKSSQLDQALKRYSGKS